jgi:hypothetical protein
MSFKDFRIFKKEDEDHREAFVEIHFQGIFFGRITQEDGLEKLQIEIYNCPQSDHWTFPLDDFLKMIELSKQKLCDLRESD